MARELPTKGERIVQQCQNIAAALQEARLAGDKQGAARIELVYWATRARAMRG